MTETPPHYCEICETPFYTLSALANHDCERDAEEPDLATDGGAVDIGDLHAASVLEVDGEAVLAIKGTDGAVRLHVPEDMVTPFQDTVDEVESFYSNGETDDLLIGDGGRQETPLSGQERCTCGRLVSPEWSYCPSCGQGLPVADGGEEFHSRTDQTECTTMQCSGEATYAYWMPGLGGFSRVRSPEHDRLDDGDLAPYVCKSCRDRMAASPHWERDRFINPREKLMADGGAGQSDDAPSHLNRRSYVTQILGGSADAR